MKEYNHLAIEKKWQKEWEKKKIYTAKESKSGKKFFGLIEFPYPSGAGLHVGHVRSNTAMDIISRKRRMEGYSVLYPIGWDAFGLPTEQYAIKTGTPPAIVTKKNTDTFRKQLKSIGFGFDWSREINTTDPKYYKWTQWIFLQFYKKGLAYKAKTTINWCPKDKIGLANEEVVNGACERCGTPTEKREKEQWMLAITKYADRLDKDLDDVDFLPRIKTQQRNWIGKSEGMLFTAPVKDTDLKIQTFSAHFEAFSADTFVVIAPDHPFLKTLVAGTPEEEKVLSFSSMLVQERMKDGFEEKEPKGIFTGRYISDPVGNGDLPIWVASFALADYGTGIVKCSCHDERDFAFAKKYNIPLKPVLFPKDEALAEKVKNLEVCFSDAENGVLTMPIQFQGKNAHAVRADIVTYLEKNGLATRKTTYKLRDWVFSRQRYWGEPIPIVHCPKCGEVPVPEKELPLKLPKVKSYMPTDNGESPLAVISKWVNTKCPTCKGPAKRETDTMPNWAGSSWYYLRYVDPKNAKHFASKEKLDFWTPVDWYNGGMEHTTLHLLYSRFWHKFLYDIGLVPTKEPYQKRTSHGMILAEGGEKMSKSRGNVVNPDDIISTFGADTFRLYEMFMGPFDQAVVWSTDSMVGPRRFIERVWKMQDKVTDDVKITPYEIVLNQTIKKVGEDIETMGFNTAVSQLMMCLNEMEKSESVQTEDFKSFLKLLAPFSPHVTEELWSKFGEKKSIHLSSWPEYNSDKLVSDTVTIMIQVNSKNRGELTVPRSITEAEVTKLALLDEKIKTYISGEPKKVIYVPGRLINIVA